MMRPLHATRRECLPGKLRFSHFDASYTCGNCLTRILRTAGRMRVGNVWFCPGCKDKAPTTRPCCGGPLGRTHKAGCPMARPRMAK